MNDVKYKKISEILFKLSQIPKNTDLVVGKSLGLYDYYECMCGRQIHLVRFNYAWGVQDLHNNETWYGATEKIYDVFNLLKEFYKLIHGDGND